MPSFEKNKSSGLWSVRFRESSGIDGTVKNKRLSGFKTKKEAQYGYEDYIKSRELMPKISDVNTAPQNTASELTFSELAERFYAFQKQRLKSASYYDMQKKFGKKILPFFKSFKMKDITSLSILKWQDEYIAGYSYKYRKNIFNYLVAIYNFGEKYYDIPNIMRKVDRPRNLESKREMQVWEPKEFKKFIKEVTREEYRLLFTFLYLSGARRGEALALGWEDINLDEGTVSISKSITFKGTESGELFSVDTPKNKGSNRKIPLPSFFINELKEYKSRDGRATEPYVFGGARPLAPTTITRVMLNACEASGVKKIRVHDLRHSCASYLIHKGVTIVGVSRHLGHSSTKQTLDTYSHMLPEDNTMIKTVLSELKL